MGLVAMLSFSQHQHDAAESVPNIQDGRNGRDNIIDETHGDSAWSGSPRAAARVRGDEM